MSSQRLEWLPGDGVPRFLGRDSWGHVAAIGGGEDGDGSKPSDLLPLSLAACTAHDVVIILRKQRQDLLGLEIRIETDQDPEPPWAFRRIGMHFVLTGAVDPGKARRAIDLAEGKYCAVAATLRPIVEMAFTLEVLPA
ncbi:MAG: OsmC family protein [Actinobacteria bacterium]|nr:OsmC family protein [Actinomycetota bacterium]